MIRICGVVRESIVDGPGLRFVLFTQGCPHHCPGCHNPESHALNGGYEVTAEKVLEEFKKNPLLKGNYPVRRRPHSPGRGTGGHLPGSPCHG